MKRTILSKRALLLSLVSGFVLFVALSLFFTQINSIQDGSELPVEPAAASSDREQGVVGLPVRITIPAINVDADIISVGKTSNGEMDVPEGPAEVAWYSPGPLPGEQGSAVMTGHYDWYNNVPAVFDDLNKVKKGDKIVIEDENEITSTFVVRTTRIYGKDDNATDVFISSGGTAHLNLITCTGTWNSAEKTFSDRLVVFADKE
ncbi:TPA: hypothetical protein DEB00_02380 [Candidatus Uhrbacteria bacterium]|nr:hypothetical protein [Candidatus Uhrbacteria bacterium]